MANLPEWTPLVIILTIAVHGTTFAFCDSQLPANSSSNLLKTLLNHITASGCTTDPVTGQAGPQFVGWFQWALFLIGTLGFVLILYALISPLIAGLLANSIAGSIAAVAGFAAVITLFGILILQ